MKNRQSTQVGRLTLNEKKIPCSISYRHNFTIIELLVVLSIIIILAGLLLPSLNKARDKAKAISCLANLKQLGIGIQSYTMDYNDYFPIECTSQLSATTASRKMITVMLKAYIPENSAIYRCPDEHEGLFEVETTSYLWNWGQIEYSGNEKSGKSSYNAAPFGMSSPSNFPLMLDASPYHSNSKNKKGLNVLYADSRVDNGDALPF
jgi:competence protein ComGC